MRDPVFLFVVGLGAGGWELQRAISSTRKVLVWRSAPGSLNHFLEGLRLTDLPINGIESGWLQGSRKTNRKRLKAGEDILPYVGSLSMPSSHARRQFRNMLESMYGALSAKYGFPEWGIYDPTADKMTMDLLRTIYPNSKFVFLVRHPIVSIESSLKSGLTLRDRWGERSAEFPAESWLAKEWASKASQFHGTPYGMRVRYEDLEGSSEARHELADYLGLALPENMTSQTAGARTSRSSLGKEAASCLWPLVEQAARLWNYEESHLGCDG